MRRARFEPSIVALQTKRVVRLNCGELRIVWGTICAPPRRAHEILAVQICRDGAPRTRGQFAPPPRISVTAGRFGALRRLVALDNAAENPVDGSAGTV
jgi:hypothetical protein